jgi:ATP-dependent RNA helicase DDX52/ROK1
MLKKFVKLLRLIESAYVIYEWPLRKLRPFMIDNVSKSAKKISGQKLDILVTTPNRLVYMINNEQISMKNVEWLIVDESDKLFETTGKGETSFRDQLATIYR